MCLYMCLLSPLQNFCTHVQEASLGLTLWEERNGFASLVDVVFSHSASLFNAVALNDKVMCLFAVSMFYALSWKLLKLTLLTSPSSANRLPTSVPSSLLSFQANSRGAVARPSSKSAPAGLPSSAPLTV